jgi:hypothetical protein
MAMIVSLYAPTIFASISCPNLTEDANSILGSISGLRGQIKKAPECSSLSDKLQNINDIVTNKSWSKVRDILNGKTDVELSPGEIKIISSLVGTASANITEVISSFKNVGETCIDSDGKTSFLSRLSVLTKEVSNIVGNLSGPYSVAVNLGGSTLASTLSGIDRIFQARSYSWIRGRRSFDYTVREDEVLFMNQFCAFTEIQKDVNEYLATPTRQLELEALENFLEVKVSDLRETCQECDTLSEVWIARRELDQILTARVSNSSADLDNISKCMRLADMAVNPQSEYFALKSALGSYSLDGMSQHHVTRFKAVVVAFDRLEKSFPTYEQCLDVSNPLEEGLDHYDTFVTKILIPTKVELFDKEEESYSGQSNEFYKANLGAQTIKDLNVLTWLRPEIQKIEGTLENGIFKLSSAKITEAMRDLEDRIIGELMPDYLVFLGGKNLDEVAGMIAREQQFRRAAKAMVGIHKGQNKARGLNRSDRRKISKMNDEAVEGFIASEANMDTRTYEAELSRLLTDLRTSLHNSYAFGQYCDYIRYANNGTIPIERICSRYMRLIKNTYKQLMTAVPDFKQYIDLDNLFPKTNLRVATDKVKEFDGMLKAWELKHANIDLGIR